MSYPRSEILNCSSRCWNFRSGASSRWITSRYACRRRQIQQQHLWWRQWWNQQRWGISQRRNPIWRFILLKSSSTINNTITANSIQPTRGKSGMRLQSSFCHEAQFIEFAFNTYGFKRGMKSFIQCREDSLDYEFLNLHKWSTFHPKHLDDMTNQ